MKLALSTPDSEAHNPINVGRDRGCKELSGDVNSRPDKTWKRWKSGDEMSRAAMKSRRKEDAGGSEGSGLATCS